MRRMDYNFKDHGFVGHMSIPERFNGHGVIVIMGGEKSLLPGTIIGDRFADYGIMALSVSLFGAKGLESGANRIPVDMFIPAVKVLQEKGCASISAYGMSMGSVFAALVARYVGGIDNIILCSPTHVPFEGSEDKKSNTGRSVATWQGRDVPFVSLDFAARKMNRYYFDKEAGRRVMGMWIAYRDAYRDKEAEAKADLKLWESGARILLIAGTQDEAWPSDYSVRYIEKQLEAVGYKKDYKAYIYPYGSHLIGMMPNREREKKLYGLLPVIGLVYKTLGRHKKECLDAFEKSEKEIIRWILGEV